MNNILKNKSLFNERTLFSSLFLIINVALIALALHTIFIEGEFGDKWGVAFITSPFAYALLIINLTTIFWEKLGSGSDGGDYHILSKASVLTTMLFMLLVVFQSVSQMMSI